MKKIISMSSMICLLLCMIILLNSCGQPSMKEKLIGGWHSGDYTFTFTEEGTCYRQKDRGSISSGTYSIFGGLLIIEWESSSQKVMCVISIADNVMIMEYEEEHDGYSYPVTIQLTKTR